MCIKVKKNIKPIRSFSRYIDRANVSRVLLAVETVVTVVTVVVDMMQFSSPLSLSSDVLNTPTLVY